VTNHGQTDVYLPFSLIGLAGGSLDLLALASEENALRLWAALPNANPVNSARVINTEAYVGSQQFSLTQRYHWDNVAAGICPNGSLGGAATARFADTDLQVHLAANPAGATYSLIQDNLFWLQQLLLGTPPADVAAQLAFLAAGQPPVGPNQPIVYTLTYRNRGADTATGVTANVTAEYALRLNGGDGTHQTVALGDILPGAEGTATFSAVVDTSRSPEAWAAVAVEIHDAAHPAGGSPIEWLWAHHRVDRNAPQFFGIQQPDYVVGLGANTVSGYAYDEAGVPLVSLEVQGQAPVNCPVTAPQGGQWRCDWPVTGSNGELLQVKLHARDSFGQEAAWANPLPFLVDAAAPTVAFDLAATQVVSGSVITSSAFPVYGDVADPGGVAKVEVCTSQTATFVTSSLHSEQVLSGSAGQLSSRRASSEESAGQLSSRRASSEGSAGQLSSRRASSEESVCALATLQLTPGQSAVTYNDAPAGPLPIGGSCVARTFAVAENFSIGQVMLGFAAEHPRRDELQVELASPGGATVRALYDDGAASVHFANYDVLLSDAATTALADSKGDHDPAAPYFDRSLRPYAALQAFQGQNSQGTWTLTICDRNAAANDGSYLRSRLTLTPRDNSAKIGRWSFQSPATGQLDYVQRSLAVYAEDVVGNRTSDPLRLNVWVDNVSPAITVTAAIATVVQGRLTTVLTGTVTDGSPLTDVSLQIQAPDGGTSVRAAARNGENWWYDLQPETAGRYTLWAVATDQAGNSTTVGPFAVDAICTDAGLTVTFVSAEPAASSPFSVTLTAVVSNTGTATVAAGLPVAFSVGEKPIGVALTAQALGSGQSVTVALDWAVDFPGDYEINVVPNSGGAGQPLALCRQPAAARQTLSIADLPLYQSWNLVSSAVNPFVPAISTVQRPIAGRYFVIQSFDAGAKSYYPSLPPEFNTLKTWDAAHGYWIKTTVTTTVPPGGDEPPVATLRLSGLRFAEDHPLPLAVGWNLVSYLPQTALPVTVALESIAGKYAVVQGFDHGAQSFYPDLDPLFNTLQVMQPGMGYWIRATQAVTLTYPSSAISVTVTTAGTRLLSVAQPLVSPRALLVDQAARSDQIRQAERAAGVQPMSAWVDFYGPAVGSGVELLNQQGAALPVGAVVKAVDPQGVVCGATVVTTAGQYGLLACYGDDPDTPADEGAVVGDRIRLMVGGEVLGIGYWAGRGERQWVALGKVNLWRTYLPNLEQGAGPATPESQPPAERPSLRYWLPLIGPGAGVGEGEPGEAAPEGWPSPRLWLPLIPLSGIFDPLTGISGLRRWLSLIVDLGRLYG
jgi:subtilisin-like proprotein convertase family protein